MNCDGMPEWFILSMHFSVCIKEVSLYTVSLMHRYNESAHTVEFLADGSSQTYWQSEVGETPVTVQLKLASLTNLSKIFIRFESALPTLAILEYMQNSQWEPLQYWADNCSSTELNERLVSKNPLLIKRAKQIIYCGLSAS